MQTRILRTTVSGSAAVTNNASLVESTVQTPARRVNYEGTYQLAPLSAGPQGVVKIEHPSGTMELDLGLERHFRA